jgi:hypothetical protein
VICCYHAEAFIASLLDSSDSTGVCLVSKVQNVADGIEEHQTLDSEDLIMEENSSNHNEEEASQQYIWEVENPSCVVMSDAVVQLAYSVHHFWFVEVCSVLL